MREPIHAFLEHDFSPEVQWLPGVDRGRYLADPFGISKNGQTYVFCEEFDYRSLRGAIAVFQLSDDGVPSTRSLAIEMPFHLSYPYLVEWGGNVYCIPEMHQMREIGLFKADQFPNLWDRCLTLVPNFAGVDPTIVFHRGRWWIFSTDAAAGPNEALYIWHADNLTGPWKPHAANPMRRGRYGTRPAGTPFTHKGQLYRPAMDSTRIYGKRIVLNLVERLTTTEFEEEPIGTVEPMPKGRYRDGVHTISAIGESTLVDGSRIAFETTEFHRALGRERHDIMRRFGPLLHKK